MKASQPCSGCLVHPSMWIRPPPPLPWGQKLMGPTLICVGVGWVKRDSEGFQARPGVGEAQLLLGLTRWGRCEGVRCIEINVVGNHGCRTSL